MGRRRLWLMKTTSVAGIPTQVKNIFTPEARSGRKILEGKPEEQVEALIQELRGIKCL
jgi:electron transfer flavoprotein beta subunit